MSDPAGDPGKRTTAELVLLILTLTVAVGLLLTGAGLLILAIVRPELDQSTATGAVTHALTTMLGAVLGYLAGRGRR